MGARFATAAVMVAMLFTGAFAVSEWAREGSLRSELLHRQVAPWLMRVSGVMTDLKLRYRGERPVKNRIVLVEIDEPSLKTLGRWPWPRDYTTLLLEKILAYEPRVVGLDMFFSEPEQKIPFELEEELKKRALTKLIPQESGALVELVRLNANRLVLGWNSENGCFPRFPERDNCPVGGAFGSVTRPFRGFSMTLQTTEPGFRQDRTAIWSTPAINSNIKELDAVARHSGFVNALRDPDGTVRVAPVVALVDGVAFPSLPLEMARTGLRDRLAVTINSEGDVARLGWVRLGTELRVNRRGMAQINYRGTSERFDRISAVDLMGQSELLKDQENRKLASVTKWDILRDAYVIVGVSALGIQDVVPTPFEASSPGMAVHATVLDNLLSQDALMGGTDRGGFWIVLLLMTVGVLGLAAGAAKLDAVPGQVTFMACFALLAYIDFDVLFAHNRDWNTGFLYLEGLAIMLLTLMAKYVAEEDKKKFIRAAFAKYLAPAVVDEIVSDPSRLALGGRRRPMTILFSDIRGFTTFSERMDAKLLSEFLNDYLSVMTRIVFENRGTLDKYIGDAIMAFWGAPLESHRHASDCCQTAIRMMAALDLHGPRLKAKYGVDVAIGVGINTGEVSVGNMGSEASFSYTVIGDSVNLASRLEGATKAYGIGILTTQFTLDEIRASGERLPPHRALDLVKVKGKKKAVEIVEILHREIPQVALELFQKGRELYARQDWDGAEAAFRESDRLVREATGRADGPSEVYLDRCAKFRVDPPGADWEGSWEFDSK